LKVVEVVAKRIAMKDFMKRVGQDVKIRVKMEVREEEKRRKCAAYLFVGGACQGKAGWLGKRDQWWPVPDS